MTLTGSRSTGRNPSAATGSEAARLLAELRNAHVRLADALAELERIASGPPPDPRRFTSVRWRLSRVSLNRRMLWAKILGYLLPRAGHCGAANLRRLQDDDIALLAASTRHVATWTTEAAIADWPRYCEASSDMRGRMAAGIAAEKELLCPMLEAAGRGEISL